MYKCYLNDELLYTPELQGMNLSRRERPSSLSTTRTGGYFVAGCSMSKKDSTTNCK